MEGREGCLIARMSIVNEASSYYTVSRSFISLWCYVSCQRKEQDTVGYSSCGACLLLT